MRIGNILNLMAPCTESIVKIMLYWISRRQKPLSSLRQVIVYVAYLSNKSHLNSLLQETIRSWFVNHQIDGVKIRDLSQLQNIDSNQFVTKLWDNLFGKNDTTR